MGTHEAAAGRHDHRLSTRCDRCVEWPAWWLDLALRLEALGDLMTESNAEQARLDADVQAETAAVDQLAANFQAELDALRAQIDGNPSQPAEQLDLSGLEALIATTKQLADAQATAPAAAVPSLSTPPMVTDPPVSTVPAGKPLYEHVTAEAFDPTQWPAAGVASADGTPLYTYIGDQPGGEPTGASASWDVYTGPTVTVGSQAPTGVVVPLVLPDPAAADGSATA